MNEQQIDEKIENAKRKWEFIKQNRQKIREAEMFNKYSVVIKDDNSRAQNKKKKVMKKIKASELRKWSYKHITKYIGRGEKLSLQKLQIKNKGEIERCMYEKEEIEKVVMEYNCKYYKKPILQNIIKIKSIRNYRIIT